MQIIERLTVLTLTHCSREAGTGIKGAGEEGVGDGERGGGVWKFWGRVLYQNLLHFTDFSLFLCTSMQ